ncbi:MAG: hypothetical protein HY050_08040 [Actinobacteria bacterium]|nr:hypothetical protein [Actinomycetota bacterium]
MAVKKATAKRSVAKKAVAKKSARRKAPAKKSVAKKSTVKWSAVKKAAVKKAAVKKAAVKKAAVKKAAVKKAAVKKAAVKKSTVERIVIPEAPITTRTSRVEIVSTPTPAPAPAPAPVTIPASTQAIIPVKKQGASGRVIFAVVVGLVILGLIVWSQANSKKDNGANPLPSATSTATPTASETPSAMPSATESSAALAAHEAPQGVVAQYTPSGATIFWKAPAAIDGLTGYNIEISLSNGPWKLISTVPTSQLSLDVQKDSTTGWTSFKVSSVYSDSIITPAKAFGLPGTYS